MSSNCRPARTWAASRAGSRSWCWTASCLPNERHCWSTLGPIRTSADRLAAWAAGFEPTEDDLALAHRSLVDTVAVAVAGRGEAVTRIAAADGEATHWAAAGHALDYDDLHLESTAHISVVCLVAALSAGSRPRLPDRLYPAVWLSSSTRAATRCSGRSPRRPP